jgi:hypothetical protein
MKNFFAGCVFVVVVFVLVFVVVEKIDKDFEHLCQKNPKAQECVSDCKARGLEASCFTKGGR